MLPSREELRKHLLNKMTNQDIAKIYGVSFQKIIQLSRSIILTKNPLEKRISKLFMNIGSMVKLFMLEVEFGIDAEGILIEENCNIGNL